jgi:PTS system fructose-specific IIC component
MRNRSLEKALQQHLTSVRDDLLTGVSYMVPFVTTGGLLLALAFAYGVFLGDGKPMVFDSTKTVAWFLAQAGTAGLTLMIPVLGAYVAYSIGGRPALAPAFILSYLIQQSDVIRAAGLVVGFPAATVGAGYPGALMVGLVVGAVVYRGRTLDVPRSLKPMMPIVILPVGTTLLLLPVALFFIGVPGAILNNRLTLMLANIAGGRAVLVGTIVGTMMAFDMGGPVNKVAYLFAFDLTRVGIHEPMAAVMVAGMTPPIGLAISNRIAPQRYPSAMYEHSKSSAILGLSFITEGAIPYAASDPLRVIPGLVAGSAVAANISLALGVTMPVPHGGIFVVPFANSPFAFLGAVLVGSLVTAVTVTVLKPEQEAESNEDDQPTAATFTLRR